MVVSCGRVALSDAEDLVMDAVVKLHHLQTHPRNAHALLFTAAMNGLRSKRRTQIIRTRNSLVDDCGGGRTRLDWVHSPDSEGLARLEANENEVLLRQMLREAFGRLSATDREVLAAYYFENRPLRSIDQERGDRIGAAKVRLFRARRRLQRVLAVGCKHCLAA
jgi:RNA polymerase sigma factor (sigma-70 family)